MEKLNKLMNALKEQADRSRKVEQFMRDEKMEDIANKVREESIVLNQMSVSENKQIRDDFYALQIAFRKSLNKEQTAMYDDLEAYSNILALAGQRTNGSK